MEKLILGIIGVVLIGDGVLSLITGESGGIGAASMRTREISIAEDTVEFLLFVLFKVGAGAWILRFVLQKKTTK